MRTYGKLREKIRKFYGTQKAFADVLDMSVATLNSKLNGKTDWTMKEVEHSCKLLEIPLEEMKEYFFYS